MVLEGVSPAAQPVEGKRNWALLGFAAFRMVRPRIVDGWWAMIRTATRPIPGLPPPPCPSVSAAADTFPPLAARNPWNLAYLSILAMLHGFSPCFEFLTTVQGSEDNMSPVQGITDSLLSIQTTDPPINSFPTHSDKPGYLSAITSPLERINPSAFIIFPINNTNILSTWICAQTNSGVFTICAKHGNIFPMKLLKGCIGIRKNNTGDGSGNENYLRKFLHVRHLRLPPAGAILENTRETSLERIWNN